jgi:hypothetical protein
MKEKVAIATVSGKAYYLIVDELRRKDVPFLSLTPYEPIPIEIKVVITTPLERHLIKHERVLVLNDGTEPETLVNEAQKIIRGKSAFERITIGVDPGEVFGLAVLANGNVVETENCFSIKETLNQIKNILRNHADNPTASVSVKIGDGVPDCKETLLHMLDRKLPSFVTLETVSEAGTSRPLSEAKHRRGLRDIVSAIQIAGRSGQKYHRRKADESNS